MSVPRIRTFCAVAVVAASMAAASPAFARGVTLDPDGRSSISQFLHDLFASIGVIEGDGGEVSDAGIATDPIG